MAHPKPVAIPKNPGWLTLILVQRALLKRQVKSRFGEYRLGFLWFFVEPLTGVLVLSFLIGPFVGRAAPEMPYSFFLLNGFMLMRLLTKCMNNGMNLGNSNSGLLVYKAVKPIDPLLSSFLFVFLTTVFPYLVFCLAAMWLGVEYSLGYLGFLLSCYLITWALGSGLGLTLGVVVAHFPESEKVINFIQRPLIFVSAVLYPSSNLPSDVREWLMWNPLLHTIEQARHALFPFYNAAETNLLYPSMCALVFLAIGVTLFQNNQHFLASR